MTDKHLSTQFDADLDAISNNLMRLGGLVESQVSQAIYALSIRERQWRCVWRCHQVPDL